MYERFTDRARKIMHLANQEAQRFNHDYIGTEHILLGLVKEGSGVAANVLKNLDIDLNRIRQDVEAILQRGTIGKQEVKGRLPHTPRAKKVIDYAVEEARGLNHNYVGSEHLLLGLLREEEGVAAQVLTHLGLKIQVVRDEVMNLLGMNLPNEKQPDLPEPSSPPSDPRARDLDDEIERLNAEKETAIVDQDFKKAVALRDQVFELKRRRAQLLADIHMIPKELQPGSSETYPVSDLTPHDLNAPQPQRNDGDISLHIRISSAENPVTSHREDSYSRFTDRSRKVMQLANQEAQRFNHEYIGTEHILLGLVKEGSGVAANVLKNLDIDLNRIRHETEKIVQHGPGAEQVVPGRLPQTPRARKVIDYSLEEARNLNHDYVGTEHLLLGLLREQEGVAAQVLMNLGLKLEDLRNEILNLLGHNKPADNTAQASAMGTSRTEPDEKTVSGPNVAPESLTVHQLELVHERIRVLNEQKVAAQDILQASQFRAEAEALKKLLNLYTWFQSQS